MTVRTSVALDCADDLEAFLAVVRAGSKDGLELLRRLDQTMTSRAARSRAFEERLQSDEFF